MTKVVHFPMALYVDAKSAYAAVTAICPKAPAETSLLSHAQYIREKLDDTALHSLFWIDTRDIYTILSSEIDDMMAP